MKPKIHTLIVAVLALAACLFVSSCNTMRGVGRDVQHVGNAIENTAH